jgi:predicted PurR-regulated permease PerM
VVVVALRGGRAILIPIALATLLAFLLGPVVTALHRWGLSRTLAILLLVLALAALVGGGGWAIGSQATTLLRDLPHHKESIKARIAEVRKAGQASLLDRARGAIDEVVDEIEKDDRPPAVRRDAPVAVVVREDDRSLLRRLPGVMGELAAGGLVIILALFMLVEREELRNRFIRLAGHGRLAVTTKALDEAAVRVSRFLLTQSLINAGFGAAWTVGLLLLGVPYALLWGVALALGRFIPFVGVWTAALMPMALSLALGRSWTQPLMVLALFVVLEVLVAVVVEPVVVSQRVGVSKVALLASVAFWTWLWGPVGLVLATPLTVCLLVFAKYVPGFEFIAMLVGEEPALRPGTALYQRLLAMDEDEATEIVEERLKHGAPDEILDAVVIPALAQVRQDRMRGRVGDDDVAFVVRATRRIVEDTVPAAVRETGAAPTLLLGCPTRDGIDEVALVALARILNPGLFSVEVVSPTMLSAEVLEAVDQRRPGAACVGSVAPGGLAQTRYLVKRLRARFPTLKIVVGRWGIDGDPAGENAALVEAGADVVATTLRGTRDQLFALAPVVARPAVPAA